MRTNPQRIKELKQGPQSHGPVVYWMSRDQRIDDNWALIHAQDLALAGNMPLRVVFCLVRDFLDAGLRQYGFMLRGLEKCRDLARSRNIPLDLVTGDPEVIIPGYLKEVNASRLVMDFDPLRIKKQWRSAVLERISIKACMVDAHNIIPCWITSDKQEYAARTIRPKIHRVLDEYLEPFPGVKVMDQQTVPDETFSAKLAINRLGLNSDAAPVDWISPGSDKALETLDIFIGKGLPQYERYRNDPNKKALSNLSPYLHFGQISSQTIALRWKKRPDAPLEARDGFLDELVVRKELSDNFCYYNKNYDNFEGLPEWGRKTLNKHLKDKRPYLYSLEEFEQGLTHDFLWNAAQMEMAATGKMHGYMRMYWAKKIIEWTKDPCQAIEWAIYLNDRYELDGRDPNGYTGIMWAMGGLHDRPWKEREVFGTVRYMSYNGCKRKFDVQEYINRWTDPGR